MRTREEILNEVVDAFEAGSYETSDGSYTREGCIEAAWYRAITDNQKLILEVLLDIRDGVRPPSPAVLDAEAYKAP